MDPLPGQKFCLSLPKIELHAHLNGSLSDETLRILGCCNEDILDYQKSKNFPDERNLQNIFTKFSIAHKYTLTPDAVYKATKNIILEYARENVIYLELRTTPRCEEGMSAEMYIERVITAIQETKDLMMVKLILSLNRQHSLDMCENNLDLILKMKFKYPDIIRGIDLSGNPIYGSFNELRRLFEKAKNNGLHTTIHCGEIENTDELEEVLSFKPDRIGHACCLHPNYKGCAKNWNILKALRVPTEICLTSNIMTGSTDNYENHHLQEWIKDNLPFSLNTDDKGVFDTTLTEEFLCAMRYFKLDRSYLWKISMDSIEHSFANNEEKLFLKSKLMNWKEKNCHLF